MIPPGWKKRPKKILDEKWKKGYPISYARLELFVFAPPQIQPPGLKEEDNEGSSGCFLERKGHPLRTDGFDPMVLRDPSGGLLFLRM
jgi:hypothetical protein